jgi:hypothetical protein
MHLPSISTLAVLATTLTTTTAIPVLILNYPAQAEKRSADPFNAEGIPHRMHHTTGSIPIGFYGSEKRSADPFNAGGIPHRMHHTTGSIPIGFYGSKKRSADPFQLSDRNPSRSSHHSIASIPIGFYGAERKRGLAIHGGPQRYTDDVRVGYFGPERRDDTSEILPPAGPPPERRHVADANDYVPDVPRRYGGMGPPVRPVGWEEAEKRDAEADADADAYRGFSGATRRTGGYHVGFFGP